MEEVVWAMLDSEENVELISEELAVNDRVVGSAEELVRSEELVSAELVPLEDGTLASDDDVKPL